MTTAELPADVADLIRRGEELQAEREAERRRALAAAEAVSAANMKRLTDEIRAAFTALPPSLLECVTLRFTTPEAIMANGVTTAWIELPGCYPILVNVQLTGDGWHIGQVGDRQPYRVADHYRYATLPEATAAARQRWLETRPVPAGLS
jgi:hypothetical protein